MINPGLGEGSVFISPASVGQLSLTGLVCPPVAHR